MRDVYYVLGPINIKTLSTRSLQELLPLTNQPKIDLDDRGGYSGSGMQDILESLLLGKRPCNSLFLYKAFSRKTNEFVGWGLLTQYRINPRNCAMWFYVKHEHRQKGLATKIFEKMHAYAKTHGMQQIGAEPWNNRSTAFFKSLGFTKDMTRSWSDRVAKKI